MTPIETIVYKKPCPARNLYPYDFTWAVTFQTGPFIDTRTFGQDEGAARDFARAKGLKEEEVTA